MLSAALRCIPGAFAQLGNRQGSNGTISLSDTIAVDSVWTPSGMPAMQVDRVRPLQEELALKNNNISHYIYIYMFILHYIKHIVYMHYDILHSVILSIYCFQSEGMSRHCAPHPKSGGCGQLDSDLDGSDPP